MSESKIGLRTSTKKIGNKKASKPKNTYTKIFVSKPNFWHFFWIKKIHPYAKVMSKKPQVGPIKNRRGASKVLDDARMTSVIHGIEFDG